MGTNKARKGKAKRGHALTLLANGRLSLADIIWKGYDGLGTCPVHKVLEAAPSLGPSRVRTILEHAKVYPLIPLEQLTALQREAILNELPSRLRGED